MFFCWTLVALMRIEGMKGNCFLSGRQMDMWMASWYGEGEHVPAGSFDGAYQ